MRTHGLLFYPGMAIVRLWTRSPYGHVAVLLSGTVWEAVSSGVRCRPYDPTGKDKPARFVPLPRSCKLGWTWRAVLFLERQEGKPYDWQAICFDVFGKLLGTRARLTIAGDDCWDCSRLAAAVLFRMGWNSDNVADLRCPVSPGDLYTLLTQENGGLKCS